MCGVGKRADRLDHAACRRVRLLRRWRGLHRPEHLRYRLAAEIARRFGARRPRFPVVEVSLEVVDVFHLLLGDEIHLPAVAEDVLGRGAALRRTGHHHSRVRPAPPRHRPAAAGRLALQRPLRRDGEWRGGGDAAEVGAEAGGARVEQVLLGLLDRAAHDFTHLLFDPTRRSRASVVHQPHKLIQRHFSISVLVEHLDALDDLLVGQPQPEEVHRELELAVVTARNVCPSAGGGSKQGLRRLRRTDRRSRPGQSLGTSSES